MTSPFRLLPATPPASPRPDPLTGDGTWRGPTPEPERLAEAATVKFPTIEMASAALNLAAADLRTSHPGVFEKYAAPTRDFVKVRDKIAVLRRACEHLRKQRTLPSLDLGVLMLILGAARLAGPGATAERFENALIETFRNQSGPGNPADATALREERDVADALASLASQDSPDRLADAAARDFTTLAALARLENATTLGAGFLARTRLKRERPRDYWKEIGDPLGPKDLDGIITDPFILPDAQASVRLRRFVERHAALGEEKLAGYASFALNEPPLAEPFAGGELTADFVAAYGENGHILGATLIPEVGHPEKILVIRESLGAGSDDEERLNYRVLRPYRRPETAPFLAAEGLESPAALPRPFFNVADFEAWESETFNGIAAAASRLWRKTQTAVPADTRQVRDLLDTLGLAHNLNFPVARVFFDIFFGTLGDACAGFYLKTDFTARSAPANPIASALGPIEPRFILSDGRRDILAGTLAGEPIVVTGLDDGEHALVLRPEAKPALFNARSIIHSG